MTNTSSKTNFFNGSISGVAGSDNEVKNNNFTQINNADTTEILKLIASLRDNCVQFPEAVRNASASRNRVFYRNLWLKNPRFSSKTRFLTLRDRPKASIARAAFSRDRPSPRPELLKFS